MERNVASARARPRARFHVTVTSVSVAYALSSPSLCVPDAGPPLAPPQAFGARGEIFKKKLDERAQATLLHVAQSTRAGHTTHSKIDESE